MKKGYSVERRMGGGAGGFAVSLFHCYSRPDKAR